MLPSVADIELERLSPRARETLREIAPLVAEDYDYDQVAQQLDLSGGPEVSSRLDELAQELRALDGGAQLPPLSQEEYEALRDDIAARGQLVPALLDRAGEVIDGHHRLRACAELGIAPLTTAIASSDEQEARELSLAVNLARRHVSAKARRELIAAELIRDPSVSDRAIARRLAASHPTVAAVRAELEQRGQVERLSTRVGSDGVAQPATKPAPAHPPAAGERTVALLVPEDAALHLPLDDWMPCEAVRLRASPMDGTFILEIRRAA